tara:strand:- start:915 stop:2252 length:1338 start_codon:yes stop_codon:yes gene_type:complete
MIAGGAGETLISYRKKTANIQENITPLFIALVIISTILLCSLYLSFSSLFLSFFELNAQRINLFISMTTLIVLSKIPGAIVSGLQYLVFMKDKYNYFIIASLVSESAGVLLIALFIESYGIIIFPAAALCTATINALFFVFVINLNIKAVFKKEEWKSNKQDLKTLVKQTITLSVQTLITYLSQFWERIISIKFMTPGYLSALNYSKKFTEYPKMIMLSSLLTTSYVEQIKRRDDRNQFIGYTNSMQKIISEISLVFQVAGILFGPFLLVYVFNRGAFDDNAVVLTLALYQLLSVGFLPGILLNFLSRTMFVEQEYRKLLYITIIRFTVEVVIMTSLIKYTIYSIPIALVASKFIVSIIIFRILNKKNPGIFNTNHFTLTYLSILIISFLIIFLNNYFLPQLLALPKDSLLLIYLPMLILYGLIVLLIFKRRYANLLKKLNIFKR